MFLQTSLVFVLYFFLMLVAVAYTYITVESLVTSYQQPVRSYMSTFKKRFDPPAIIVYPEELDAFLYCDFEVKKDNGDKELPIYDDNNCSNNGIPILLIRVHKQHTQGSRIQGTS